MALKHIPVERACVMLAVIKEFQNLSPEELEVVAGHCQWHRYEVGEDVIRYHDKTDSTFFIVQGIIRITYYSPSGHEVILCDLSSGEMFGELTAIDGLTRSAAVIARRDSVLASIPVQAFLNLIYSNREICLAILKRLTGQIRRLTDRVFDFSTLAVRNRIHAELLRLAKNQMGVSNMAIISPAPTHADIASRLSTHREAVTRELNELVRQKVIIRRAHDLHILDMAKLTEMVEEIRGSFR